MHRSPRGRRGEPLAEHYQQVRHRHLGQPFAEDPGRGKRLTAEAAGLYLDYLKHRVTNETLACWSGWPGSATWLTALRPCSAA